MTRFLLQLTRWPLLGVVCILYYLYIGFDSLVNAIEEALES